MTCVASGFRGHRSRAWGGSVGRTLAVLLVLSGVCWAQQKPDFSGTWVLDPSLSDERGVYGQMRIVRQGPSSVEMTVLHFASGSVSVIPWHLPFDKWSPRRGGESSREPIVQSRWDGDRLITLKAQGTSYSVLWMWSLSPDGRGVMFSPEGEPFVLRFGRASNTLSTTCLIKACAVVDVVNGGRGTARTLTTGGSATFSVDANTVVERGP